MTSETARQQICDISRLPLLIFHWFKDKQGLSKDTVTLTSPSKVIVTLSGVAGAGGGSVPGISCGGNVWRTKSFRASLGKHGENPLSITCLLVHFGDVSP